MSEEMKEDLVGVMHFALPHFFTHNTSLLWLHWSRRTRQATSHPWPCMGKPTVVDLLQQVSATVWREGFWLPEGVRWGDLRDTKDLHFPQFYDVWVYPVLLALVFLLLQHLWLEPRVLVPLARNAGLHSRPPPPQSCPALEALYRRHKTRPPWAALEEAARVAKMEVRQAERWLRAQHQANHLTQYDLFVSVGSTFTYHTLFTLGGWAIMYGKPWTWNTVLCWQDYPYHNMDRDVWWYYIAVLAFYYSMLMSEWLRPRRSNDGRIKIMLHHFSTVVLMSFSWVCNFVRVGTLVILVHECADALLMLAKMCIYAKKKKMANVMFVVFLFVWLITRCGLYPFWVMRSVFIEGPTYMFMPSAFLFMGLLTGLLFLNLIWTCLIFRTLIRSVLTRSELKEPNSSSDAGDTELEATKKKE